MLYSSKLKEITLLTGYCDIVSNLDYWNKAINLAESVLKIPTIFEGPIKWLPKSQNPNESSYDELFIKNKNFWCFTINGNLCIDGQIFDFLILIRYAISGDNDY